MLFKPFPKTVWSIDQLFHLVADYAGHTEIQSLRLPAKNLGVIIQKFVKSKFCQNQFLRNFQDPESGLATFTSPSLTSSLQTSVRSSCGQLQILNLEPNSSPSSNVLGKCFHRVSGKNNAAIPPTAERVPMMTKGKT